MKEVYKFGGTSVDLLEHVANVVIGKFNGRVPHVCVSAFSKVTDQLLSIIDKAQNGENYSEDFVTLKKFHYDKLTNGVKTPEYLEILNDKFSVFYDKNIKDIEFHLDNISDLGINYEDHDAVIGFGEQISAYLLAELVTLIGKGKVKGKYVDLGNIVSGNYEKADKIFLDKLKENISKELISNKKDDEIPIITGYFGHVPGGILNSIDRGYTDFTAAFTSSSISASRLIIFKEVDGICTADPRVVGGDCILLKHLTYIEVLKMASAGMKAINTEAVKPAMKNNIPIEVRNTFTPEIEGTLITANREMTNNVIQVIPSKKGVCVFRFGTLDNLMSESLFPLFLQLLNKHKIKMYFFTSDEAGSSVVLKYEKEKIEKLVDDMKPYATVRLNINCSIVAIVGEEMRDRVGVIAKASSALAGNGMNIYVVAQGASQVFIGFVIDEVDTEKGVKALHQVFFG